MPWTHVPMLSEVLLSCSKSLKFDKELSRSQSISVKEEGGGREAVQWNTLKGFCGSRVPFTKEHLQQSTTGVKCLLPGQLSGTCPWR